MTLDELHNVALYGKSGAKGRVELARAVFAYHDGVRRAEAGATPRQQEILDEYEKFRSDHGRYPTQTEVAERLGVDKCTVFEHVDALVRKGLMRKIPNVAGGVSLVR